MSTVADAPFVYERVGDEGKRALEGFCADLLKELSKRLGFTYHMALVADGEYGKPIDNTSLNWNGMVGEVMFRRI